ncbi:hypothetical protein LINPERPRIM_LOCUS31498 [Linum perenne]
MVFGQWLLQSYDWRQNEFQLSGGKEGRKSYIWR